MTTGRSRGASGGDAGRLEDRRPTPDDRELLREFERADADLLEAMLAAPTPERDRALRLHLGEERFHRLHWLAMAAEAARSRGEKSLGNVVVIPGMPGSSLATVERDGDERLLWPDWTRLARGAIGKLRMAPGARRAAGRRRPEIRPCRPLWTYYGELVLALRKSWDVAVFPYDWRADLDRSADLLMARIAERFGRDEPVHLVAHGMGGLVARTFVLRHPDRWDAGGGRARLVMLGTPNHGTYVISQTLCGLSRSIRLLERLDPNRDLPALLRVVRSFPGLYQLLPSPLIDAEAEDLYDPATYGPIGVAPRLLDEARAHHDRLAGVVDEERMTCFVGAGRPTPDGLRDPGHLARCPLPAGFPVASAYRFTDDGDGAVPRRLAMLRHGDGSFAGVPTYRVDRGHDGMLADLRVLSAVDEVLRHGRAWRPDDLGPVPGPDAPEVVAAIDPSDPEDQPRPAVEGGADREVAERWAAELERTRPRMEAAVDQVRAAARARPDGASPTAAGTTAAEQILGEGILRDLLVVPEAGAVAAGAPRRPERRRIAFRVVLGGVEQIGTPAARRLRTFGGPRGERAAPIDAIAAAHYRGEKPREGDVLWALDREISRALLPAEERDEETSEAFERDASGRALRDPDDDLPMLREARRLLSQYIERGTARGDLGQPFFVPDPRTDGAGRLLVLSGMGVPGAFGTPELTVLVRELVWSIGKLGKRHLASAPIGTRNANIPVGPAVEAWVRGVEAALSGAVPESQDVDWITFYLPDPRIIPEVDRALQTARTYPGLDVDYRELSPAELRWLRERMIAYERRELERRMDLEQACWERQAERSRRGLAAISDGCLLPTHGPGAAWRVVDQPVRVTVRFTRDDPHGRGVYQFGAITQSAAIPMRQIDVDPALIEQANAELAEAFDPADQYRHGRFLAQLLLPRDFRDLLQTAGPIVLMVDPTAARIHWELMARPDLWTRPDVGDDGGPPPADEEDPAAYLGTSRGLTRQLITGFAPPPEPPPPSKRTLRVLIVADPARDHPLPGARHEGIETLELFHRFGPAWGGSGNRVEVDVMIGSIEATRTNVLRQLMSRTYDVFHYAGHCYFDPDDPPASGLLFGDGEVLSALELRRIDRVPRFVFLNACESGVIPAHAGRYDPAMAPSFAEAFFERGVSNLVCTAWPVYDAAARAFSQRFYRGLLGLDDRDDHPVPVPPLTISRAMERARLAVAGDRSLPGGVLTWGAYQHYGNPDYAFFDGSRMRPPAGAEGEADGRPRRRPRGARISPGIGPIG